MLFILVFRDFKLSIILCTIAQKLLIATLTDDACDDFNQGIVSLVVGIFAHRYGTTYVGEVEHTSSSVGENCLSYYIDALIEQFVLEINKSISKKVQKNVPSVLVCLGCSIALRLLSTPAQSLVP